MNNSPKSFTLIEMLIVIVIIGILAAALVPRLTAVQGRARDTKRKTDLRNIANGLEIYLLDYGTYPVAGNTLGSCSNPPNGTTCYVYSNNASMWISGLNTIITSMPKDPIENPAQNSVGIYSSGPWIDGYYMYAYGNVARTAANGKNHFDLYTQLENRKDPERNELKLYTFSYTYNALYPTYSWRMYAIKP